VVRLKIPEPGRQPPEKIPAFCLVRSSDSPDEAVNARLCRLNTGAGLPPGPPSVAVGAWGLRSCAAGEEGDSLRTHDGLRACLGSRAASARPAPRPDGLASRVSLSIYSPRADERHSCIDIRRAAVRRSDSQRKFLIEVRRRGWVVVLSTLLVVGVAWQVGKLVPPSSSAEAVLVVHATGPEAEQANSSTKLAATYASLIPLDAAIKRTVESALPSGLKSYTTSNDPNTAVLRVNLKARTKSEAIEGAGVVARAVSGPDPASANIAANTVAIVSLPTSASGSVFSTDLLAVAVVLGLLLGFILLSFWRPRDVRVDTLQELRRHFECPCLEVHLATTLSPRPLIDLTAGADGRTTAVVPCRAQDVQAADALCEMLSKVSERGSVTRTGVPGSEEAGELAAANADSTILVVVPGVRLTAIEEVSDLLDRYRASPAYAILARGEAGAGSVTPASDRSEHVSTIPSA
jgi:hypothetical protein